MFTNVNGVVLFYEKQGNGYPLIMLHGNGENHSMFNATAKLLSKDFCVYRIDSRGHGQSQPVDELSYYDMCEDVAAFIKKKHIEKPVLYGFSDGGIIGLLVASKYPEMLSKLIVSGANAKPSGLQDKFVADITAEYECTHSPLLLMMMTQPDITPAMLHRIKIPVLMTAAETDLVKETHTYAIAKQLENCQVIIVPGETHDSYVANNPKLYEVIAPFLYSD